MCKEDKVPLHYKGTRVSSSCARLSLQLHGSDARRKLHRIVRDSHCQGGDIKV